MITEKKFLLIYLSTGGEHRSIAKTIAREMERLDPSCKTILVDALTPHEKAGRSLIERGYRFLSAGVPGLWKLLFEFSRKPAAMKLWAFLMKGRVAKRVASIVQEGGFTGILNLHFLATYGLESLKSSLADFPPVLTLVTDPFYVHPVWNFRLSGKRVVFSERARRDSIAMGAPEASIASTPFPYGSSYKPATKDKAATNKEGLGLDPERKLVLILGEGDGFPDGRLFFEALLCSESPFDLAIYCGKDDKLRSRCAALAKAHVGRNYAVLGPVDSLGEIVAASDIVVATGGPSSVFQALACEKALIVARYAHGHERGNVEWLLKEGLGWYQADPALLRTKVELLLADPAALGENRKRIKQVGIRNGLGELAEYALGGDWLMGDLE